MDKEVSRTEAFFGFGRQEETEDSFEIRYPVFRV